MPTRPKARRATLPGVLARRLLMVLAALLVLTAVTAELAAHRAAAPGAGATAVPSTAAGGAPATVQKTLTADAPDQQVVARVGQDVVIDVEGEQVDTVTIGDLDTQTVDAGSPAHFDLLAETPGRYPIELVEAGRRIGTLEIRPAAR
jgi:hypothetical protein